MFYRYYKYHRTYHVVCYRAEGTFQLASVFMFRHCPHKAVKSLSAACILKVQYYWSGIQLRAMSPLRRVACEQKIYSHVINLPAAL
jgi:hypothetical protein